MNIERYERATEILEEKQRVSDMLDLFGNCFCGKMPTTIALLYPTSGDERYTDYINTARYSPEIIDRCKVVLKEYYDILVKQFEEL